MIPQLTGVHVRCRSAAWAHLLPVVLAIDDKRSNKYTDDEYREVNAIQAAQAEDESREVNDIQAAQADDKCR